MRVTTGVLPAGNIFSKTHIPKPTWGKTGKVATTTPKKQIGNDMEVVGQKIADSKPEPIAAFSRPPPMSPMMGPLVALSLLQTWSSRDTTDE